MDLTTATILILYLIGFVFTAYYQNKKLDALSVENKSLLRLMQAFDPGKVAKYIDLSDRMKDKELQEKITQVEERLKQESSNIKNERDHYLSALIVLLSEMESEERDDFLKAYDGKPEYGALKKIVTAVTTYEDKYEQ